jgi:polyisoprenoid-binding protein YceI
MNMSHLKKFSLMILFLGFHHVLLHAATYTLDHPITSIGFSVKHLMITDVTGQFKTFKTKLELDENTNELKGMEANIQVSSIDMENAKRDGHFKES